MQGTEDDAGTVVIAAPEAEGVGFERHEAVTPPRAKGHRGALPLSDPSARETKGGVRICNRSDTGA